jgi:hypothetical protein
MRRIAPSLSVLHPAEAGFPASSSVSQAQHPLACATSNCAAMLNQNGRDLTVAGLFFWVAV